MEKNGGPVALRQWSFSHPTHVRLGSELETAAAEALADVDGPIALLTGRHAARETGMTERVLASVPQHDVRVFDRVEPEPSHATVHEAAGFCQDNAVRTIVALGGGSVLDAAKAVACMTGVADDVTPYMDREVVFEKRQLGLIAIPTTAGTGSEVTPFSVLTNEKSGQKKSLPSPHFYPDQAIVIPSLLGSVPQTVRGDVGLDSIAHAFEALWSRNHNPVSDALAIGALEHLMPHVIEHYEDAAAAQAEMAIGATLAGMAFSNTLTAGCHALSYPLCDIYGITHGAACAMTLAAVAELNAPIVRDKFEVVARSLGLSGADRIPQELARLRAQVPTIPTFTELGIGEADLGRIADGAFAPLLANNPIEMTQDVIVELLRTVA